MPRSLLPPKGVYVPPNIAYDTTFSPAARDTYMQLRGLAWGKKVTPKLAIEMLSKLLGKSPSTIYGHLAYLRDRPVLCYEAAGDGTLIVTFLDEDDSGNLESLLNSSSSPISNLDQSTKEEKDIGVFQVSGMALQKTGKKPIERKPSKKDPRTDLPAIQCVKGITSRFPQKELYDDIIRVLGDRPDVEKLLACRKEWLKRGYNPNALTWALEWYQSGIPDRFSKNGSNLSKKSDWIAENGGIKRVRWLLENGALGESEINAHRSELLANNIDPDSFALVKDEDAPA